MVLQHLLAIPSSKSSPSLNRFFHHIGTSSRELILIINIKSNLLIDYYSTKIRFSRQWYSNIFLPYLLPKVLLSWTWIDSSVTSVSSRELILIINIRSNLLFPQNLFSHFRYWISEKTFLWKFFNEKSHLTRKMYEYRTSFLSKDSIVPLSNYKVKKKKETPFNGRKLVPSSTKIEETK